MTREKRGKACYWYNARKIIPLVPSMRLVLRAVKQATRVKRGKKCDPCKVRENVPLVQYAGKHATGALCEKTYIWCKAQDKMQPVPSVRQNVIDATEAKTGLDVVFD